MRGTVFSKFGHRLLQYLPGLGCVNSTIVGSEVASVRDFEVRVISQTSRAIGSHYTNQWNLVLILNHKNYK